jgi:hypothetical protein
MQPIYKSRKFWIMVVDLIVSLASYFLAKYASPDLSKDVLFLIGALQPVVLLVIASYTVQNLEAMKQAGVTTATINGDDGTTFTWTSTPNILTNLVSASGSSTTISGGAPKA